MGYVIAALVVACLGAMVFFFVAGRKGAVAQDDIKEIEDALEEQDTARDEVRSNRRRLRDLLGL